MLNTILIYLILSIMRIRKRSLYPNAALFTPLPLPSRRTCSLYPKRGKYIYPFSPPCTELIVTIPMRQIHLPLPLRQTCSHYSNAANTFTPLPLYPYPFSFLRKAFVKISFLYNFTFSSLISLLSPQTTVALNVCGETSAILPGLW